MLNKVSHAIESHLVVSYWFVGREGSYVAVNTCMLPHELIISTLHAYTVVLMLYILLIHSL